VSKLFTIFGNPVSHSISPLIHNYTIKSLGAKACYTRTRLDDGAKIRDRFFSLDISGANVTVPFKEDAFLLCDKIEGIAKEIKAVNTIVKKDTKLIGYNTDAPGFYESIKEFDGIKSVLILGAGGTAKAISIFLKEKGLNVTILNRSEKRLGFFKDTGFEAYSWSNYEPTSYDLVVNTTSAGLKDENLPLKENILSNILKDTKYAVDAIYNKQTPFLKLARKLNLHTKDGTDMLIYQAVLAFEIFFDRKYKREDIKRYMFEALALL
jgi:shikimate dehydrogenase